MACYEDLRQALAATAKERDEAVKRLREWEKFWADIALMGKMPPKKWEGRDGCGCGGTRRTAVEAIEAWNRRVVDGK